MTDQAPHMRLYVDHTHLGRAVTGLERITLELFSPAALAPLDVVPVTARGTAAMVLTQTFGLPALMARSPSAVLLCPGFPPSPLLLPFAARVIPYIHDVFLLSRRRDLNTRAKLYMAAPFRLAVRRLPLFLVNSADTGRKLAAFCRPDAKIMLYRPCVRNVFDLRHGDRARRAVRPAHLRLAALGTVEPRKNFRAAARIAAALTRRGYGRVTLDIVGRKGWGDDWEALAAMPDVTLHGYQSTPHAAAIIDAADAFICTSHEEGLGLPLLEAQYAGLPVIAPDQPVFREALDASGLYVDPRDPEKAADAVAASLGEADWRHGHATRAARNLERWNALARADRSTVVELLGRLAHSRARRAPTADASAPSRGANALRRRASR
jgi:glycosyltransferase involved in cell wall biosynthesis